MTLKTLSAFRSRFYLLLPHEVEIQRVYTDCKSVILCKYQLPLKLKLVPITS